MMITAQHVELGGATALSSRPIPQELASRVRALRLDPSPASLAPERKSKLLAERLFDALAEAKIVTSQVAMHMSATWRSKLFRQLDSLHEVEEWQAGDDPVQTASVWTFLQTMLDLDPDRRPGLGLTGSGYLVGAWDRGSDRLTMEFQPNGRIRWVASREFPDGVDRVAGETMAIRLKESNFIGHWLYAEN